MSNQPSNIQQQQQQSAIDYFIQCSANIIYANTVQPTTNHTSSHYQPELPEMPSKPKPVVTSPPKPKLALKKYNDPYHKLPKVMHLPLDTNPFDYIATHDRIPAPIITQLINLSGGKITKTSMRMKGIHKFGDHLWVKLKLRVCEDWHYTLKKIKAHTFNDWMDWIPKQQKPFVDSWSWYVKKEPRDSTKNILKKITSNNQDHQYAMNQFRQRLHNFINALKKTEKLDRLICFRCGAQGHSRYDCESSQDIDGNILHEQDLSCRFKFKTQAVVDCYCCGEIGHKAVDCPRKLKRKLTGIDNDETVLKKQKISKKNDILEDTIGAERVMLTCVNCGCDLRGKEVWRCSKCKSVLYCNKKCQLFDWKRHKIECGNDGNDGSGMGMEVNVKVERISVHEWSHFAIVYWLNRVNDNIFNGVGFMDLRKHIIVGRLKGCELLSINNVTLRMVGIHDYNQQESILNAISDVVVNDNFDNLMANRMRTDDIPIKYVDPVLYELMDNAVKVMPSGYIYDKAFVTKYIEENKSDPITRRYAELSGVIQCIELNREIEKWKKAHVVA